MSSHSVILAATTAFMGLAALAAPVTAAPNTSFGTCDTRTERAICDWVARCARSGGEPHRLLFSTSMTCCADDGTCKAMPEAGALMTTGPVDRMVSEWRETAPH